jgi:hypothetical protein
MPRALHHRMSTFLVAVTLLAGVIAPTGSALAQTATGGANYNRRDRERAAEQVQENWINKHCRPPSCNREDPNLGYPSAPPPSAPASSRSRSKAVQ